MRYVKENLANHKMEIIIGNLLRIGVITAAVTVFLGGVIYLLRYGAATADYRFFQNEPSYPCSVHGILIDAFSFHELGLMQLGVLLLIATPIARVALSIFGFVLKRDTLYVIVTSMVFCILIWSLFGR